MVKTVHDLLRQRILDQAGISAAKATGTDLEKSFNDQVSEEFLVRVCNRMIMGHLRYGGVNINKQYDPVQSIKERLRYYYLDGNLEHLVDAAALAMVEYMNPTNPLAHWSPSDDGEHAK